MENLTPPCVLEQLADSLLPAPVLRAGDEDVPQSGHLRGVARAEHLLDGLPVGKVTSSEDEGLVAGQGEVEGDREADQTSVTADQQHAGPAALQHLTHPPTALTLDRNILQC